MARGIAFSVIALLISTPTYAQSLLPHTFMVEGRLFNGGTPLDEVVDIKIELVAQPDLTCVLYREIHTGVDLRSLDPASVGYFSVPMGTVAPDYNGSASLAKVFANDANLTGDGCSVLSGTLSNAHRYIKISFKRSSGGFVPLDPPTVITSIPTAMVADTLSGKTANEFVQIAGSITQANAADILGTRYSDLDTLLDGNSPTYVKSSVALTNLVNGTSGSYVQVVSGAGATIPTVNGDPSTLTVGQIWYNSVSGTFRYQDSSGTRTVGVVAVSGGDIQSGEIGGSTSIDTTGAITTTATVGARAFDILDSDSSNFVRLMAPATSSLTADYSLTLPQADGANGQFLMTDGNGHLQWTIPPHCNPNEKLEVSAGPMAYGWSCVADNDTNTVTSVFGRTGAVVVQAGDYEASLITNEASGDVMAVTVQAAVDELDLEKLAKRGDVMTGNLVMNDQKETRYADNDSSNYAALRAPTAIATNFTLTLPDTDGNANDVLVTDGSGNLSWIQQPVGAGDITEIKTMAGSGITGGALSGIVTLALDFGTGTDQVQKNSSIYQGCGPGQKLQMNPGPTYSWACENITVVRDADNDTKIQVEESADEDQIRFDTAGAERMIIDGSGKVGVGTTSPNELLTVAGVTSLKETAAPAATANYGKLYVKSSDSKLYFMNDSGAEIDLTGAAALTTNSVNSAYIDENTIQKNDIDGTSVGIWDVTSGNVYRGTGNVGIGTSNPSNYRLEVSESRADLAGTVYTSAHKLTVANSSPANGALFNAVFNQTKRTSGQDVGDITGSHSQAENNSPGGSLQNMYGARNEALDTSGLVTNMYGSFNQSKILSGNVTKTYGAFNESNRAATVATQTDFAYGSYNTVKQSGAGSTTDKAYGVYSEVLKSAGTLNTSYGVYVGNVQATTTNQSWSIYTNDSNAPSYFAGKVAIGGGGSFTPLSSLHVSGNATFNTNSSIMFNSYNNGVNDVYATGDSAFEIWHNGSADVLTIGAATIGTGGTNISSYSNALNITHDGRVGVGTNSPQAGAKLHVSGGDIYIDNGKSLKFGDGGNSTYFHGLGINGTNLQVGPTSGSYPIIFNPGTSATAMNIAPSGNVSIGYGTTSGSYPLDVNGTIRSTDILLTSDARAKKNIRSLASDESLEKICRLRPVSFDWKHNGHPDEGVIAQEIREIFPEFVVEASDGRLSVKYPSLIAPLIASVQELNKRNQELTNQVEDLKDKNQQLQNQMNSVLQRLERLENKGR